MPLTPEEIKDMVILQRQVVWQYDLDAFTTKELKRIQLGVNRARTDVVDYFAKRGDKIGDWTANRLDDTITELDAMTVGLQTELGESIESVYAQAGKNAMRAQNNIMSFGGKVAGFNAVALSAGQLKSIASTTSVGGQQLNYWVNREFTKVMKDQLRTEVMAGMMKGEGYQQFVKRLEGKFNQFSKTELTTLVRTYVQDANVRAQVDVYKANPDIVKQVKWSAVLEPGYTKTGRGTCIRCSVLDGNKYDFDEHPMCPLHPRCRCILLPVTASYRDLGLDIDEIGENYRPYTIRPDKNIDAGGRRKILEVGFHKGDYSSFFKGKSKGFQMNLIGPNRMKLLDEGKVTFKQLVSPSTGRLRTLDDLKYYVDAGFPKEGAMYAKMTTADKAAIRKLLVEKGPYPTPVALAPLTGQEVKMLASELNIKTFGRNRAGISDDIMDYYKRTALDPPTVIVPKPVITPPIPMVVTQGELDVMSWTDLRNFGRSVGVTGKHNRAEWNRLILKEIAGTPKITPVPKVPLPAPTPADYKALSWTDIRAYGRDLGISGKYKRPELEALIEKALKKGGNPASVAKIVDKADDIIVAKLTPQDKLIRQQKEFDEFFKLEDQKGRKQWKYPGSQLQYDAIRFADSAPAIAQHQRLMEARVNYMTFLKKEDPEKWVKYRKATLRKQLKFTSTYKDAPPITDPKVIDEIIDMTHEGTAHIDDGLFLELDRGGLKIEWQQLSKHGTNRASYFDGGNNIRLFYLDDTAEIVGHEYGHAVDRWLSGKSSHWGSGAGNKWSTNMFVDEADGVKYRKLYDKQKTSGLGNYNKGDGKFYKGNWVSDYEGRIYTKDSVGEQFWAMGSERYTKYDGLLRGGQWEKMTDADKWLELSEIAQKKVNNARIIGDKAAESKWFAVKMETRQNSVRSVRGEKVPDLPSGAKNDWAAERSGWAKQRRYYPEFAEMQEHIYKTKWDLKNDAMWKDVLKAEDDYNVKQGFKRVSKANTDFIEVPEVVKPPEVPWEPEMTPGTVKKWVKGSIYEDRIFYHTTGPDFMDDIAKSGFDVASEEGMAFKVFGEGGYFSANKTTASMYQDMLEDADFKTYRFRVKVTNPKIVKAIPDNIVKQNDLIDHIGGEVDGVSYGAHVNSGMTRSKALEKVLREKGYDSLHIDIPDTHKNFASIGGNQLLVFDQKNIVALKGKGVIKLPPSVHLDVPAPPKVVTPKVVTPKVVTPKVVTPEVVTTKVEWKPSMTNIEADKWAVKSTHDEIVWHVTGDKSYAKIADAGFDTTKKGPGSYKLWGDGAYFGTDKRTAKMYEDLYDQDAHAFKVNVKKTYKVKGGRAVEIDDFDYEGSAEDIEEGIERSLSRMIADDVDAKRRSAIFDELYDGGPVEELDGRVLQRLLEEKGYDSMQLTLKEGTGDFEFLGGNQFIVFDKKNVVALKGESVVKAGLEDLTSTKWPVAADDLVTKNILENLQTIPEMKYVKVGKVFDPKQKYRTIMISDKEAMGTPVTIPGGKEHTGMAIKVYKNGDIVVDEISSGRPGWGTKMVDNLIENSPSDAKIYVHNDWSAGWWDKMAAKYPKNIIFDYDEGFGTAIRKGVKPSKIVVPKVIKPKVSVTGLLDEVDKGKYPQYKLTNQEDALIDRVSNDVSAANRKYKHVRKNIKTDDLVFVEKEGRVPGVKRSLNLSPEDLQKELDSKHIVVVDLGDGKYYTTAFDDSELMAAYKRSDIDEIRVTVVDPSDLPKPKVPMVNRSSEVFTDAKKLHADMEVFVKTVDPAERSIIETYIKDSSSSSWNADLRSDMPASKWLKSNRSEYDNFLKSYSKLPKYDGVSYRGISFDDSVVHKNFIDGLEEGGIFVEKGLMSTSSSRYTALNFVDESEWSKGVLFKVRGKTGRPISEFVKEGYDESEILFAPNSKFKIVKKSKVDGRWQIELEELDSTVVAKKKAVEKVAAPDKVMGEQFKAPKAPAIDPNTNYTRSGDIFMYQGQVVQGDVAKRLKAMKLPPAWKDVVISTDPSAKIQAIGTARNGKTQYRYSAEHVATKAREKFERSRLFSGKLGTIRGKVEVDILKKNPKAMLLKLEDETGIRIGTNADLNAKTKAYGLTTLEHRHAKVVGNKVTLDFVAKEGINAHYEVTDRHLAEFIKDRIEISKPGEKLFPDVTAKHLNKYLRELSGDKAYSIKDYRTFHGTRIAFEELEQYAGKTLTDVEKTKIIEEVTLTVSKFLHNTPAMARKSYIDPMVWDVIGGL